MIKEDELVIVVRVAKKSDIGIFFLTYMVTFRWKKNHMIIIKKYIKLIKYIYQNNKKLLFSMLEIFDDKVS